MTGDSFILDVRAFRGGRDGYAGASRYLTKYLTKASSSGSLAHELELDLSGFQLIGSWGSSPAAVHGLRFRISALAGVVSVLPSGW